MSVPDTQAEMPKPPTDDGYVTTFNTGGEFFKGEIPGVEKGAVIEATLVEVKKGVNTFHKDNPKPNLEWFYVPEGFDREEHGALRSTTGIAMLPEDKATLPARLDLHGLTRPTESNPHLLKANGVDSLEALVAKAKTKVRLVVSQKTSKNGKKYVKIDKVLAA